jgi:hypothetical protein
MLLPGRERSGLRAAAVHAGLVGLAVVGIHFNRSVARGCVPPYGGCLRRSQRTRGFVASVGAPEGAMLLGEDESAPREWWDSPWWGCTPASRCRAAVSHPTVGACTAPGERGVSLLLWERRKARCFWARPSGAARMVGLAVVGMPSIRSLSRGCVPPYGGCLRRSQRTRGFVASVGAPEGAMLLGEDESAPREWWDSPWWGCTPASRCRAAVSHPTVGACTAPGERGVSLLLWERRKARCFWARPSGAARMVGLAVVGMPSIRSLSRGCVPPYGGCLRRSQRTRGFVASVGAPEGAMLLGEDESAPREWWDSPWWGCLPSGRCRAAVSHPTVSVRCGCAVAPMGGWPRRSGFC